MILYKCISPGKKVALIYYINYQYFFISNYGELIHTFDIETLDLKFDWVKIDESK